MAKGGKGNGGNTGGGDTGGSTGSYGFEDEILALSSSYDFTGVLAVLDSLKGKQLSKIGQSTFDKILNDMVFYEIAHDVSGGFYGPYDNIAGEISSEISAYISGYGDHLSTNTVVSAITDLLYDGYDFVSANAIFNNLTPSHLDGITEYQANSMFNILSSWDYEAWMDPESYATGIANPEVVHDAAVELMTSLLTKIGDRIDSYYVESAINLTAGNTADGFEAVIENMTAEHVAWFTEETGGYASGYPVYALEMLMYTSSDPYSGNTADEWNHALRVFMDMLGESLNQSYELQYATLLFDDALDSGQYYYNGFTTGYDSVEAVISHLSTEQYDLMVELDLTSGWSDLEWYHDNYNVTFGTSGGDIIAGTANAEVMFGAHGDDNLYGDAGNDSLYGNDGNDVIVGGAGDDRLSGGDGNDTLTGGAGADTFAFFDFETGIDTVTDFNTADGDALDISDILNDFDPLTDAIAEFVRITDNGTDTVVAVDSDGGTDSFATIAVLEGVTGLDNIAALEAAGNLII